MSGIYTIINVINGKIYIGSSINIKKRWNTHLRYLIKNIHPNIHLQASFNKYGKDNFVFKIIQNNIIDVDLIETEQYYINLLNPEYNKRLIANSNLGSKFSDFAKINMSKAMSGCGNNFYGKRHSEESKLRMSKSKLGKSQSKEAIDKRAKIMCKPIYQYDLEYNFIKEYKSLKEAALLNNFNYKYFGEIRLKKNYKFKNYYWLNTIIK